jgi:hypothetical protein
MPYLAKKVLSRYFRTECRRQLRLDLSPDNRRYQAEREKEGMPPPQPPRPGLEQIAQAGEAWEAAKLHDLTQTFGAQAVVGAAASDASGRVRYNPVPLQEALNGIAPDCFIVQAEYEIGAAFETALGIAGHRAQLGLGYARVRPDLIEVLPPGRFPQEVTPSGEVLPLPEGDARLQLRVIDIKLTAEPSPGYFAEIAYYTMALAGWLADQGLDGQFAAVPDGAVWPGSHDAAKLTLAHRQLQKEGVTPSTVQLQAAMAEDLEPVPFEVFVFRVRRFLQEELPEVLSQPWRDLAWHVDNRCSGCDYLGYRWTGARAGAAPDPDLCIPMAERQDHLCRVAFIPRGAGASLQDQGILTVASLAQLQAASPAFDTHQVLRATRTVVSGRASSLQTQQPHIPPDAGSSAVMPKWADLRIFLSADFDLGSAITFALGMKAFWLEPRDFGSPDASPRRTENWRALPQVFIVDQKDLQAEERELLAFLGQIHRVLAEARALHAETTVQFYLWDSLQYDHLTRVIGRHLQAVLKDRTVQYLAWLFPSEELLPNPQLTTRRSPITRVREVIRSVLAAPIPHYYTLLEVARRYHEERLPEQAARFSIHPLFEDALSDQVPSERAHEIWSRATGARSWQQSLATLTETVQKRLSALETVTRRLEADLRPVLGQSAPPIGRVRPPERQPRVSADGQLWHAFAKLNEALTELEVCQIRAMPPHEREARFHSARVSERLRGAEEREALERLGLPGKVRRRVYRLRPLSREVKLREGDFSFAISPEAAPGFPDRRVAGVAEGSPALPLPEWVQNNPSVTFTEATRVTVAGIDRETGLLVLDPNDRWPSVLDDLEKHAGFDFSRDAILDPVHHDYFTRKLLEALQAVGNPPSARDNPLVRQATGALTGRGARPTRHSPPADFLWDAPAMAAAPVRRVLPPVREALERHGLGLNETQWRAWEAALTRRLGLVWGPPGTGKSRTARAILLGAAVEAHRQARPIRILLCASTYRAMDNVLLDLHRDLQALLPAACEVHRLRSYHKGRDEALPEEIDRELNKFNPSPEVLDLRSRLKGRQGITLVGGTPEQLHNLLTVNDNPAREELFDLILVDEASQMDVAHALLPLCSLAEGGSVVLAGDPKQLPPIHQAEPPRGLEAMVGSVYTFCTEAHGLEGHAVMLDENYRSNRTLVRFSLNAGYRATLSSYSPDLKLHLLEALPQGPPPDWPPELYWTPEWARLLDPDYPAACFVYPEGRSSQWNRFEADAVAALLYLLHGRVSEQLLNERCPGSPHPLPPGDTPYSPAGFWQRAVGVVTPHRAQQGLIIGRLQRLFAPTGVPDGLIRDAVDTVERFQGQQRDVIIASFALGDPDAIGEEDEFLMSLNRFNVMASRARAKLVVFLSQELADHLSSDLDVLRESRLLKLYVESFCRDPQPITLGWVGNDGRRVSVPGILKRRE